MGARTLRPNRLSLAARTRLVEAARPMALMIAKQFRGRDLETDELVSAAFEGLAKAARHFRPAEGYEFKTYAQWWVRQTVARTLVRHWRSGFTRLPPDARVRRLTRPAYRQDDGSPGPSPAEQLAAHGAGPMAEAAGGDQWAAMMRVLPRRYRLVAEMRWRYDMTLDEAGDFLGVTRERVRQLEIKLLHKLRWAFIQGRVSL